MVKHTVLISLAAALAAAGTAFAAATSSPAASARPSLRLIDTDPLTVRGANFMAGEQVTVTVSNRENAKIVHTRRLSRASSGGSFTLALTGVVPPTCWSWSVTARGSSGTHATIKVVPLCGPAPLPR